MMYRCQRASFTAVLAAYSRHRHMYLYLVLQLYALVQLLYHGTCILCVAHFCTLGRNNMMDGERHLHYALAFSACHQQKHSKTGLNLKIKVHESSAPKYSNSPLQAPKLSALHRQNQNISTVKSAKVYQEDMLEGGPARRRVLEE
jgi:hypothetical protein